MTALAGRLLDVLPRGAVPGPERGMEEETDVEGSRDVRDGVVCVAVGVRGGAALARLREEMRKSWTSTRSSSSSTTSSSTGDFEELVRPGVSGEVILDQAPSGSIVTWSMDRDVLWRMSFTYLDVEVNEGPLEYKSVILTGRPSGSHMKLLYCIQGRSKSVLAPEVEGMRQRQNTDCGYMRLIDMVHRSSR